MLIFKGKHVAGDKTPLKGCLAALLVCAMVFQPFAALPFFSAPRARAEFTLSDEMELGRSFYLMIVSSMQTVKDPEVVEYAQHMVDRLTKNFPPQPYQFKVTIIRDNSLNAFAIPGGYIFIHTGLITAMQHEAEVAGVLAHEIAHVTQRHIAKRMDTAQRISILSMLGVLAGAFLGGGDAGTAAVMGSVAAGQAAMLNYSRSDESEADQVGMSYFLGAGYPPGRMVEAFKQIQRPQWVTGSEIPAYLSTHPAITERVSDLSKRVQTLRLPAGQVLPEDDNDFLRIQTLVRARYSTPDAAEHFFTEQGKGAHKDMAALGLGILYERTNRMAKAQTAFANALKYQPGDQIVLREAGRFNYLHGDKGTAVACLQKATAQNPGDYLALYYYARLLADSDQLPEALSYYKLALREQPEDPEVHYYYAQALGQNKQTFDAYLHLAFSALYENNPARTQQAYTRLKSKAQTQAEKNELAFFEKKYAERKTFWKSGS